MAPVTTIVGTGAAMPAGTFDAVLATSANAFASPVVSGNAEAPSRFDALRPLPAFVVGKATGETARRAGLRDIRMSEGDGSALVALLCLTLPRPARLLYLAGLDRKPAVEQSLADAGYAIETFIAYEAEAVSQWPDSVATALAAGRLDAALHFSRRSADLALALADRHGVMPAFLALDHCCLSEDVAKSLHAADAAIVRVAAKPDEPSLLQLLPHAGS